MREFIRIDIGKESLHSVVEDGEVTGFSPLSVRHLNQDILGCVTYITLIGHAITKTKKKEVTDVSNRNFESTKNR